MNIPRWNHSPQGQFLVNVYKHETMLAKYDNDWLEFGPPHQMPKFTQHELEAKGLVGCYVKPSKTKVKKQDDEKSS